MTRGRWAAVIERLSRHEKPETSRNILETLI